MRKLDNILVKAMRHDILTMGQAIAIAAACDYVGTSEGVMHIYRNMHGTIARDHLHDLITSHIIITPAPEPETSEDHLDRDEN